jgi:hypothetical protein
MLATLATSTRCSSPLDRPDERYRQHRLLRGALRALLRRDEPERERRLHARGRPLAPPRRRPRRRARTTRCVAGDLRRLRGSSGAARRPTSPTGDSTRSTAAWRASAAARSPPRRRSR